MDSSDNIVFRPPEMGCRLSLTGLPGSGDIIFDRSPRGNNGNINDAVWTTTPGGLRVLDFDGYDDFISLGSGKFDSLTQCSIEFWFRPDIDLDSQATHRTLFVLYKDVNNWIQAYYSHTGNNMRLLGYDGSEALYCGYAGNEGKSQQWHYWASVFGEHGGGETWIDLSSIGMDSRTFCLIDITPLTANYIGAFDASSQPWSGNIALFRVHNRRLSLLEILQHFEWERKFFGV